MNDKTEAKLDPQEVRRLDVIGLLCPLPVLKIRKLLSQMSAGALLEVQASDPAAAIDVPHFCSEAGHKLVAASQEGEILSFVIRKKA